MQLIWMLVLVFVSRKCLFLHSILIITLLLFIFFHVLCYHLSLCLPCLYVIIDFNFILSCSCPHLLKHSASHKILSVGCPTLPVNISTPDSVTSIVCSNWADLDPSIVTAVQPKRKKLRKIKTEKKEERRKRMSLT